LWSLAATLRENKAELAREATLEMGKILREAEGEVEKSAVFCEYYADNAERLLAPEVIEDGGAVENYVRYEPLGVVLAVMPWNFPYVQVFRFAPPTLVAGNVAVLKHASNIPGCAVKIEAVFREAGFPAGVFQTLLAGSGAVEGILSDDRVRGVALTGSEAAGSQRLTEAAAALQVGDPLDPETDVGPLARPDLVDDLRRQVDDSVAVANDSAFGLGASVWTSDLERGKQVAARVDSGMVFVNSIVFSDARLPFGGTKRSGYGRELGEYGIREFVDVKSVAVHR
jgi:acyl-CoA reductase-like NAD-dependent aldehyde dehydrogenase